MQDSKHFLAVDLGATSGRTILGTVTNGKIETEELTRFANTLIETGHHLYWDIFALYQEIIKALKAVSRRRIVIESIGIDTWGVDFVCFGEDGEPLRNPIAYRDPYTTGMADRYFQEVMDRETVYQKTGTQIMDINSLYQLYAQRQEHNTALAAAWKILFTPDALAFMLTGKAVCEQTIASSSQMLNPATGDLDDALLASVGLRREQFGSPVTPGTVIGTLTEKLQRLTGLGPVPVVAVAGHDTASAIAAIPAKDERFAYLSSGTWSLMGIETPAPIINEESYRGAFTNEAGIDGTTTFLKNMCGMWIYERCRKEWQEELEATGEPAGDLLSHRRLLQEAKAAEPFRSLIDTDDASFQNPGSMLQAINRYCRDKGVPVPESRGAYCRCIFDSLAVRYRQVLATLRSFAPFDIDVLHVIGGGSQNDLLNQTTADCCGITVLAGPSECTAYGNILLQARACGLVKDRWEMRRIIAASVSLQRYEPRGKANLF